MSRFEMFHFCYEPLILKKLRRSSRTHRSHAAYVENRDKQSESELQRWFKTKSTTRA
jgi:hypothetical protein